MWNVKNKVKTSIRSKLTLWFIAIGLIPLLIIFGIIYSQRVKQIRVSAFEKLVAIRDLKVSSIDRWHEHLHLDFHQLSVFRPLRNLELIRTKPISDHLSYASIAELINNFTKDHENFVNVYVVDSNSSEIIIATNQNAIGINLEDELFYQTIVKANEHHHSDIYFSELENRNVLTFSFSIKCIQHNGQHTIGYLIGNIDPSYELYPLLLNREGLGETGETLIVDENVIAQNELRWYDDAPLKLQIKAEPAVLAAAGSTGTILAKDYRGERISL